MTMNNHDGHAESRDLAALAGLLADGTRARFCLALLDGRVWTAIELARHAGVAASTATGHLNLLVAGGLLAEERQGRHRYVRLADPGTAEMIESLAAMTPGRMDSARSLSAVNRNRALTRARTCYDHLAGVLCVAVTDAMTSRALLDWDHGLAVTSAGLAWLADLGLTLPASRRPPVRSCLDWTERRPHLNGALAAAILDRVIEFGWFEHGASPRSLVLTEKGDEGLAEVFGFSLEKAAA
jgi:DNA-binding transcriptional ArsR family regulator